MYIRNNIPLLQKMALLEVQIHNDNQPLHAGALEPESRFTYGDIMLVQREEGINNDWHKRVVGL